MILEEATLDYSLLTTLSFKNLDTYLTACYDTTLFLVSSLISRNFGLNKQVIFVHGATLEEATYKLKLSTNISEIEYKHCTAFPIHGTGISVIQDTFDYNMKLKTVNGQEIKIKAKNICQPRKTIGNFKSLSGTYKM